MDDQNQSAPGQIDRDRLKDVILKDALARAEGGD
jgi:hypothetical protein